MTMIRTNSRTQPNRFSAKNYKSKILVLCCFCILSGSFFYATSAGARPLRHDRLYSVEGEPVSLQRPGWSAAYRTYPPTMLNREDLLTVPVGTRVTLLCTDGNLQRWVGAGRDSVGSTCNGPTRLFRPSFGVSEYWSASSASEPYTITPHSGQVLDESPTFRWNAVPNVPKYEVTLQRREGGDWVDMWTATSIEASLCYPQNQAKLEPGNEYALSVRATEEAEDTDVASDRQAVFSLISGEEAQDLETEIATINSLDIDDAAKTLILVEDVYPQYKLFAQGIEELISLIDTGYETAQVYRLLGDYAVRSGLELPAEENYLKAIEFATEDSDIEEEALASWGLGTVYSRVGRLSAAQDYLQKAEQLATDIGHLDLIENISAEMERVQDSK